VVVQVNDGTVDVDYTFKIVVSNVNDAPIISSTAVLSASEDAQYSYTLSANDVDRGDSLSLSAPTLPNWLIFNSSTGVLSGTPLNVDVGNHTVLLRVNDGTVDVDYTFTIVVSNVNDAPTINSTALLVATEDVQYSYTFSAGDIDGGDSLTLSAPTVPSWLNFNSATGLLSGTPLNDDVGNHTVLLRVNDGTVELDQTFTVSVTNVNDAPIITSSVQLLAIEDWQYSYTVSASDVDVGDTLSLSAQSSLPSWLSFASETGLLTGTPTNDDVGEYTFVLRVTDGMVEVDQSFTLKVVYKITDYQSTPGAHVLLDVLGSNSVTILSAVTDLGEIRISPKGDYLFFLSDVTDTGTAQVDYVIGNGTDSEATGTINVILNVDLDGDGLGRSVATNGSASVDPDDTQADSDGDSFSDFYESFNIISQIPSGKYTLVDADIAVDTIWTLAGSPYYLSSSIKVTNDAQWIVEQGVVINFAYGTGEGVGVYLTEGSSLSVLGGATDALAVEFTTVSDQTRQQFAESDDPKAGYWAGIVSASTEPLLFSNARVYYAEAGLTIKAGDAEVDDAIFELSSGAGLTLNSTGKMTVSDSQFALNNQGLVVSTAAQPVTLTNNVFRLNEADQTNAVDGSAIYLANGLSAEVEISNSLFIENFSDNNGGALYVGTAVQANILGNTFGSNLATVAGGAIYAAAGTDNIAMIDNIFSDNKDSGGGRQSDIAQASVGPINAASQYNMTNISSSSGSLLPSTGTNRFGSLGGFDNGWYLLSSSNAVNQGSVLSNETVLPNYLERLTSPTTAKGGLIDHSNDSVDSGFHHDGPMVAASTAKSIFSPSTASQVGGVDYHTVWVTPKDADGQLLDLTANVALGLYYYYDRTNYSYYFDNYYYYNSHYNVYNGSWSIRTSSYGYTYGYGYGYDYSVRYYRYHYHYHWHTSYSYDYYYQRANSNNKLFNSFKADFYTYNRSDFKNRNYYNQNYYDHNVNGNSHWYDTYVYHNSWIHYVGKGVFEINYPDVRCDLFDTAPAHKIVVNGATIGYVTQSSLCGGVQ